MNTKLTHHKHPAKKDFGLLINMADRAYSQPVKDTEETNRQKFEAKVIRMNWPDMQTFCKNYHGHKNQTA